LGGWSASEFVKPRAWRQLGSTALLGSPTRRRTLPCWPWHLPIADRPLLHDCIPHKAHGERQVSHSVRQRTRGTPRAAWRRGRVARPLKGQRCSFGRQPSLAPPTRRMWAGVGQVLSPATPAPRTTMKGQILCHGAGAERDTRGPEATPASSPKAAARYSRPPTVQKLPGSPPTRRSFLY
jgi:hypothetical protein